MSYNIDNVDTRVLKASMKAKDIVAIYHDGDHEGPEDCFLEYHNDDAVDAVAAGKPGKLIPLKSFEWSGEWSGNSFGDVLLKKIAPKIVGHVEAIFTWEGGDSVGGLYIKDGVIEECEVAQTLVRPKTKAKGKKGAAK